MMMHWPLNASTGMASRAPGRCMTNWWRDGRGGGGGGILWILPTEFDSTDVGIGLAFIIHYVQNV